MKWVLIMVWISGNGTGSSTMQEFDSLKACQWASKQVIELKNGYTRAVTNMRCVPKGD